MTQQAQFFALANLSHIVDETGNTFQVKQVTYSKSGQLVVYTACNDCYNVFYVRYGSDGIVLVSNNDTAKLVLSKCQLYVTTSVSYQEFVKGNL